MNCLSRLHRLPRRRPVRQCGAEILLTPEGTVMNTQRLRRWLSLLAVVGLIVAPRLVAAQLFDDNNRYTIRLHDGTQVVLVGVAPPLGSSTPTNQYYYLPTNLRLSRSARDSAPEFLFLKYTTDTGGVQGGLLHFLMEWGLTAAQQQEAQQRLNEVRPRGQVLGAAHAFPGGDHTAFRIITATCRSPRRGRPARRPVLARGAAP